MFSLVQLLKKFTFYDIILFPVWLPNRLISAGLEPVLRHIYLVCIASYYRQFYTKILKQKS